MLIDWFTVIAQVVNFLILVWLLKRFLYKPILDAIDAREKRIADKLADADAKEAEALRERDEYKQKNEVFEQQRKAHMDEVLEAAKAERTQLLEAARKESEDLRSKLEQGLRNEQKSLNDELSRRAREEVFAIARKVLSDLSGSSLEQRMTEVFLDRLRGLDSDQITALKSAFNLSSNTLHVRTAFELSAEQRSSIEAVIGEILGDQTPVEFITVPDLVSGIEIGSDGKLVAWSVADYLGSLASNVDDLLKGKSAAERTSEAGPAATTVEGADNNGH